MSFIGDEWICIFYNGNHVHNCQFVLVLYLSKYVYLLCFQNNKLHTKTDKKQTLWKIGNKQWNRALNEAKHFLHVVCMCQSAGAEYNSNWCVPIYIYI